MKRIILLAFLCTTTLVMAQRINHVQEAIANYDYEAALTLIAKEKPTIPLLLQKGKAQRGLGMNTEALSTYQEIITNDTANTRAYIEAGKDLEGKGFDPRKLLAPGAEAIKKTVKEKMELFGSVGKA